MNSREPLAAFRPRAARALLRGLAACLLLLAGTAARAATVRVAAGDDLQAALDRAQPGDELVLDAGAVFNGNFVLPVKSGEAYVTVRSSRCGELPAGVRVSPAQAPLMARLQTNNVEPVLRAPVRSHHWRLQCLELTQGPGVGEWGYNLVQLGDGDPNGPQRTLADVPRHFEFDRVVVRARDSRTAVHRGISLNSAHTAIRHSHISDIKWAGVETHAIGGWNGPGPFHIEDNYLEAAGVNILFGGAFPAVAGLVPSDITIRNNHFFKRLSWRVEDPSYAGSPVTVKNLLEFKNARRVTVEGNVLENSWAHAQTGWAVIINAGSDSGPANAVEDVTFRHNIFRNTANGINFRGMEPTDAAPRMRRITVRHNVLENVGAFNGEGKVFQVLQASEDVTFDHNTATGRVVASLILDVVAGFRHQRLAFTSNLVAHGDYGVFGNGGTLGRDALNTFASGWQMAGDAFVATPDSLQPKYPGNYFPASAAAAAGLLGHDGLPVGANLSSLPNNTTPGPTPTPTPAPTATPAPAPTATPTPALTPTPAPTGQFSHNLRRVRRDAQNLSNELPVASAPATDSTASSADDLGSRISTVVASIQQVYAQFGAERANFPAASRIEDALTKALDYSARASSSASQQQLADVRAHLRRAIDYLELADVRMTHGDVNNAVDFTQFFVRQHYVDFLGREPDEAGRAFWANSIDLCPDSQCANLKRVDSSAAFFLSIEFQETGYLVYRLYRTLGRNVSYAEFLADTQEVGRGLTVGAAGWVETLGANKRAFYQSWASRPDFRARYDGLTPEQFVSHLHATLGFAPDPAEADALASDLRRGVSRSDVLARVVDGAALRRREQNRAFVLMQYFGYLKRDPDQGGYDFWLRKLDDNGGDYRRAEMVRAFLDSIEYRERFGRM